MKNYVIVSWEEAMLFKEFESELILVDEEELDKVDGGGTYFVPLEIYKKIQKDKIFDINVWYVAVPVDQSGKYLNKYPEKVIRNCWVVGDNFHMAIFVPYQIFSSLN